LTRKRRNRRMNVQRGNPTTEADRINDKKHQGHRGPFHVETGPQLQEPAGFSFSGKKRRKEAGRSASTPGEEGDKADARFEKEPNPYFRDQRAVIPLRTRQG
jgi:hypothetical protein